MGFAKKSDKESGRSSLNEKDLVQDPYLKQVTNLAQGLDYKN